MILSLFSLVPNRGFEISQGKIEVTHQGHHFIIEVAPGSDVVKVTQDNLEEKSISLDQPTKFLNLRFVVRFDNGKYTFFPQVDGVEITGKINDHGVNQLKQSNLSRCVPYIIKVSQLEQDEKQIGASKAEGNTNIATSSGYAFAAQLYLLCNLNKLSHKEIKELNSAYATLVFLAELAEKTREMFHSLYSTAFPAGQAAKLDLFQSYDAKQTYPYSSSLHSLIPNLTNKLLKENQIYLNFGIGSSLTESGKLAEGGHYEVIKIIFDGNSNTGDGVYHCIIYNAGYESDLTNEKKGLVSGVKEFKLHCKNKADIEKFIQLTQERYIRGDTGISTQSFKVIDEELKKYLGTVIRINQKSEQVRGNCTTMSTRLALEEMMSSDLFRRLHSFVSNPEHLIKLLSTIEPVEVKESKAPTISGPVSIKERGKLLFESKESKTTGLHNIIQNAINSGDCSAIIKLLRPDTPKPGYLPTASPTSSLYNIEGNKMGTLLHFAIKQGSVALAEQCLLSGMSGLEKDGVGYPALQMAIISGQTEIAKKIIFKQKNKSNVANNEGITAIKLALDCDRLTVVELLLENKIDLSPEKNNNYVILNLLMEKALLSDQGDEYIGIINKLITESKENNIDPFIVDGSGENVLEILQGKFLSDMEESKSVVDSRKIELLNNLCKIDFKTNNGKYILNHKSMISNLLPHLTTELFKDLVQLFIDDYKEEKPADEHYLKLLIPVLQSNDTEKLKYLLNQKKANLHQLLLVYMITTLDLVPGAQGKSPISKNNIELILQNVFITKNSSDFLKKMLSQFFSTKEIESIMLHAKIQASEVKEDLAIEIPVKNDQQIKNNVIRAKESENQFNKNMGLQFERRKHNYKFGDLTRAIIKLITGYDVTRKEAPGLFQPKASIAGTVLSWFQSKPKDNAQPPSGISPSDGPKAKS